MTTVDSPKHALVEVYLARRSDLRSIASKIVGRHGQVDDVLQDAYLKLVDGVCAREVLNPFGYCCVLVGWSLGGLVATELARCFPEQVQGLVLVASSPCFVEQPHWPGMQVQVLTQFAKLLVDDPAKTVERFLAIQAMGSETARQDVKTIKAAIQTLPAPDPAALAAGLQLLLEVDLRSTLSHLQQPLAGIYGRLDALVPASQLNELQRLCPHGTWELLPKASHAPFITHPQQFSDWLRHVLQQWSRPPL